MSTDQQWTWSHEFQDYYKYRRRNQPGKAFYDLIWGRNMPPPPMPDRNENTANLPTPPTSTWSGLSDNQDRHRIAQFDELNHNTHFDNSSISNVHPDYGNLSSEDASSIIGPGTITPNTNADTPRSAHPAPWSERDVGTFDNATVRTASPSSSIGISRISTIGMSSETGFEIIRNPRAYFKKGRVFKVNWPEPRGALGSVASFATSSSQVDAPFPPSQSQTNGMFYNTPAADGVTSVAGLHVKDRVFVVVRQRALHCLCLPVYTYSAQGTSKLGVKPEDHAPLIRENTTLELHPDEQQGRLKKPIILILEDTTLQWSPLSRINLAKVQSVEYNLKVKTVGRVSPDCLADLEAMFREAIGLSED